ncbi:hypothetical protein OBBRIDRAFT_34286 [Obba rivulosa]|uniref:DUF6534 domain-containing protein n=1 Tax=Obba rivulosa TaxID=1052685 RepID=A0A8E2DJN8_9APHY|nr:hypothetical protein OBBRIDRAFT_34286 [Obba rivulosa]
MTSTPVRYHLNSTLGAGFIGVVVSAVLYGITNVQTYLYYNRVHNNLTWYRWTIFLLWIMDTLHQVLITHAIYVYAVTDFGDPQALGIPTWSILAHIFVTGTSDMVVRSLFCLRLWKFSGKNRIVTYPIMVLAVVSWAGSIIFPIRGFIIDNFSAFSWLSWDLFMSMSANIAADILLASSLVILLWKRRTGIPRTDSIVRVLMLYSINTGALTSVCELLCLVMFAIMPANFIYFAILFVLPKLFLNAFLATLNARQDLQHSDVHDHISLPVSNSYTFRGSRRKAASPFGAQVISSVPTGQSLELRMVQSGAHTEVKSGVL